MAKKEKAIQYLYSPINNPVLNYQCYVMSVSEKMMYFFLSFVIGGLASQVFYGGLFKEDGEATTATWISNGCFFVVVGLIAAIVAMPAIRNHLLQKRNNVLKKQFMDLLAGLATSLSAGNTMTDAFINARPDLLNQYSEDEYIVKEVTEILLGMENGVTLEVMLNDFGQRSNNEDIINFANVISNCYRMGGNFKEVVRNTREIISDKMAVADEIETKLSSNKMQHNVMTLMPIGLVAVLKTQSSTFSENLASPTGVLITTVAIGLFVAAYFWGQKIINIS